MNSNPASLAGGSWIPLSPSSLPLSLLPVSPSLVRWRFPGWARRWGRPLHSGLGGGPGAARFPPRLSKLLISPHLAAVAGPRREAGDIVHRNVFQGRRPAAATASCAANNARTSRTPRPGHRGRLGDGDRCRGSDGCHGTHGTAALAQPLRLPQPMGCPRERDTLTASLFCTSGRWGWGAGLRAAGATPGHCPGHSWPRGPGLARRAGESSGVVRQNTELHFHLNSGNGALGAVTAASAIWCWRGSARPGGQPGGGCFALSWGCPAAEHIKAPGRPSLPCRDHTGHGRGAAGLPVLLGWGYGVEPAPPEPAAPSTQG